MKRYAKIRGGIEEHLLQGKMTPYEFGLYVIIHLQCDYQTGLWWGSASRLAASAPGDNPLRQVQRALQRLQDGRYIRTFRGAARGNYPVLIDKYEPQFGPWRSQRLDAWATTDWEKPVWVGVTMGDRKGDKIGDNSAPLFVTCSESIKQEARSKGDISLIQSNLARGFKTFWEAWPEGRKVAKPQAEKAWKGIPESEYPAVMTGLETWKGSPQWAEVEFIPYPATWLRRQQWNDKPPTGSNGKLRAAAEPQRGKYAGLKPLNTGAQANG